MDVVLHYRSGQGDPQDLPDIVKIAKKALEDFPRRPVPTFAPWFPSGMGERLPLRPAKPPPTITVEEVQRSAGAEHADGFDHLKEFSTSTCRVWTAAGAEPRTSAPDVKRSVRRCWCVCGRSDVLQENIQPFSARFQQVVEGFQLHLLQRAKWILTEMNCPAGRSLEQLWDALCKTGRHGRLPTCNVNFQRDLVQIWVFCDVLYSEHVGGVLKREHHLTGAIRLWVHKRGEIFSMWW